VRTIAFIGLLFALAGVAPAARVDTAADVPVPLTASDYFAGRDPVLAAALR
jgi:hypothetical protein